jgi:transmembrane sensor
MSKNRTRRAVIKEASEWVVRLHEADRLTEDRKRFVRWLKRSPMNVDEFLQTEADWLALEDIDAAHAIDVGALLSAPEENVVPFSGNDVAATMKKSGRRFFVPAGLAAAMVLAAVLLVVQHAAPATYTTALGEQRTVVLDDGSIVELNTQSRIRVRATDEYRDIDLLDGEVLFSVATDPNRPFRVFSDSVEVRAVGTQFNVYRQPAQTVVTVLEGNVEVRTRSARDSRSLRDGTRESDTGIVDLAAGDRVVAQPSAITRSIVANPELTVAWRERRLVFENEPLADVAAEFNRYNSQRIVIDDSALAGRRINGVFNADRPEAIVQFLVRNNDAEIVEQPGTRWVLRSKP